MNGFTKLVNTLKSDDSAWGEVAMPQLILDSVRFTLNMELNTGCAVETVFITRFTSQQDVAWAVKAFKDMGVKQAVVVDDSTSLKPLLMTLLDSGAKITGVFNHAYPSQYRAIPVEGLIVKF